MPGVFGVMVAVEIPERIAEGGIAEVIGLVIGSLAQPEITKTDNMITDK
jgi:hypothetical protein